MIPPPRVRLFAPQPVSSPLLLPSQTPTFFQPTLVFEKVHLAIVSKILMGCTSLSAKKRLLPPLLRLPAPPLPPLLRLPALPLPPLLRPLALPPPRPWAMQRAMLIFPASTPLSPTLSSSLSLSPGTQASMSLLQAPKLESPLTGSSLLAYKIFLFY